MAKISFNLIPWLITIALTISGGYFSIQSLFPGRWLGSIGQILNSQQLIMGTSLILGAIITFSLWCLPDSNPEINGIK